MFKVLDADDLTKNQRKLIVKSCSLTGYVLWRGTKAYAARQGVYIDTGGDKTAQSVAKLFGKAIVEQMSYSRFQSLGSRDYVVSRSLPTHPRHANWLTVCDKNDVARLDFKVYYVEDTEDKKQDKIAAK